METSWTRLIGVVRWVRQFPSDLAVVLGLTVTMGIATLLPGLAWLRILIGIPFVLFFPGYALLSVLFPANSGALTHEDSTTTSTVLDSRGIGGIERLTLSIGISPVIVLLIGITLMDTSWRIQLTSIVVTVGGCIILCTVGGAFRRLKLPEEQRVVVPYRNWIRTFRDAVFAPRSSLALSLNVVLAMSLVLMVGGVLYGPVVPQEDERFTEFYLLTPNDAGEYTATNYPEALTYGEEESLVVGIGNHEGGTQRYTVVVQLQYVESDDRGISVREQEELDRFEVRLGDEEERTYEHTITPTMEGEDLRLTYLLYDGEPPREPTTENAAYTLHLWVDVNENGNP